MHRGGSRVAGSSTRQHTRQGSMCPVTPQGVCVQGSMCPVCCAASTWGALRGHTPHIACTHRTHRVRVRCKLVNNTSTLHRADGPPTSPSCYTLHPTSCRWTSYEPVCPLLGYRVRGNRSLHEQAGWWHGWVPCRGARCHAGVPGAMQAGWWHGWAMPGSYGPAPCQDVI